MKKRTFRQKRELLHPELMWSRGFDTLTDIFNQYSLPNSGLGFPVNSSGAARAIMQQLEALAGMSSQHMEANAVLAWALKAWSENGKPIYRISEDLLKALAFTRVPTEVFPWEPWESLPLNGMFLSFPEILTVKTSDDGDFQMAGIYYMYDLARERAEDTAKKSMTVLAVSKDRSEGGMLNIGDSGVCMDDFIVHYTLLKDKKYADETNKDFRIISGQGLIFKLAFNFLWFYRNFRSAFSEHIVSDRPLKQKRERGQKREVERDEKKGKTHKGYTYFDLSAKSVEKQKSKKESGSKLTSPVVVPGHPHKYWTGPVKENGEKIPYEQWEEKRTLIQKWVLPYRKGPAGPIRDKDVTVRW